ncbi:MAG: hypothetical protein NC122_00730 [Faecalibacterium sp.]|nr:hypothetical protein [Ruminococcus sp.]MCM1392300.1 hypothetical protein [Ruminococcus sp.]MCM1484712.1 hypothetical protein [Faecalibacterium sp.]
MRKTFYKSTVAYFGQILIWIFLAFIFLILFFLSKDYSKDSIEVTVLSILIVESIASVCVPATMRKIVFTDNAVAVKIGFICLKKLNYDDIKCVNVMQKISGPHPVSYVFFSKNVISSQEAGSLFDKQSFTNKEDVIFCDYPQKGLKELLANTFADLGEN